jgi:hypothetical protein
MQSAIVSLQALYHEIRFFAEHFVPSILGLAVLVLTWTISRYFGRRYEQAEIKKYLPQIARDEIKERDGRIKALEKELAEIRAKNERLNVFKKFSVQRCRAIIEQSIGGME